MEAPEKIYIDTNDNLSDSILYGFIEKRKDDDIEYICKDAFIEKACKWLKEWDVYRVCLEGHKDWFIEQFKKYMEE